MSSTPTATPAAKPTETDSLRQQLAEFDQNRRRLIFELYLKDGGDTRDILEMLFATAPAATINRIEARLLEEGGAS